MLQVSPQAKLASFSGAKEENSKPEAVVLHNDFYIHNGILEKQQDIL